jgi:hypothetical protein
MSNFMIWRNNPDYDRDCKLSGIERFGSPEILQTGVPLADKLPKTVVLEMDEEFKKNVRLTDSVNNQMALLVLSRRMVDFLESKKLKNLEIIPVKIRDHKGKIASEDYSIVNPLGLQDVLDLKRSKMVRLDKHTISIVRRFVTKPTKLPAGVGIFRDKHFPQPALVDPELASEISAKGFKGFIFAPTFTE